MDWEQSHFYTCHRPVSADDIPLIGRTKPYKNLFLNLGHGSKGWTLAAGSSMLASLSLLMPFESHVNLGSLLASIIAKEKTEIDAEPFNPSRFPPLSQRFVSAVHRWPMNDL